MTQSDFRTLKYLWTSVRDVFRFFLPLGRRARKTKVFYFISFLPVLLAGIFKFSQIFTGQPRFEGIYIFSNMIMGFYLQFLILILALFYGTSVCSEELEGKTLTYITTRPVPKSAVILGKYAAYTLLITLMVVFGLIFSFLILNVSDLLNFSLYKILFRNMAVLVLGLICYTAFFTMIGTFLKRSIMFGLIFSFGWENVIQYFPGSTQRFAIVHYLKSLLPAPQASEGFAVLLFRLEPTPPAMAVLILFLVTAVFLTLACIIFAFQEYILQD